MQCGDPVGLTRVIDDVVPRSSQHFDGFGAQINLGHFHVHLWLLGVLIHAGEHAPGGRSIPRFETLLLSTLLVFNVENAFSEKTSSNGLSCRF